MLAACLAGAALAGCTADEPVASDADDGIVIAVSVPPQAWIVERVGGERVEVVTMAEAGDDPHTYEPSPQQLTALADADAYLTVGVEFEEAWLPRFEAAAPDMVVVDQAQPVEPLAEATHGDSEDAHTEDADDEDDAEHEDEAEHEDDAEHEDHAHGDPHVWTSPAAAVEMARVARDTLAELDPEGADTYDEGLASLESDIELLDQEIRDEFAAVPGGAEGESIFVLHPAWGYYARDYGLEQVPIEVEGQEPSAAELTELATRLQDEGTAVIFAQPTQDTRAADVLAEEVGAEVVLVDPLAEEWLENMRIVTLEFAAAIGAANSQAEGDGVE
jgi:zinc transport system substrate-binding protein